LLRNTEYANDEHAQAFSLFTSIWGVGPSKAQQWVAQGHRSIQNILDDPVIMGTVTTRERAGLVHATDFALSIPRQVLCRAVGGASAQLNLQCL
jgi:hypothetical protein